MAEFSSYNPNGDNPDVTAIGKDNRLAQAAGTNLGNQLEGQWVKASGTSFAVPETAGMVAKYIDGKKDWSPAAVLTAFEDGARDIEGQPRDGAGIVDYQSTIREAAADSFAQRITKWYLRTTFDTIEMSEQSLLYNRVINIIASSRNLANLFCIFCDCQLSLRYPRYDVK